MRWDPLLFIAAGYFSGGILFSWILPKLLKGVDIVKESEDHNPGTANAVKYGGVALGLLCLALDLAKGFLPVHLALRNIPADEWLLAPVIAAPVFGHAFSPMMKFRGGKAIATLFGVLIAIMPLIPSFWVLAVAFLFFSTVCVIKTNAYCSTITMAVLILDTVLLHPMSPVAIGVVLAAVVVMGKHIPSMRRESCSIHPPILLERGKVLLQMRKQIK